MNNLCFLLPYCKVCVTSIINARLIDWAETNHILPEAQGGFRKGRRGEDLIFLLNSLIQKHTTKHSKLYTTFIDFSRAFPSVNHKLLWRKLFDIGIDAKCESANS